MLSKNQTKLIRSLAKKKYRAQQGLFVVEGVKSIKEFLDSDFELERLFTIDPMAFDVQADLTEVITAAELKKVSTLTSPNTALALFKIPLPQPLDLDTLTVVLDGVNDPGNLGTIIRLCDWFGVRHLICSSHTVDCYNPKVVQATMGSLTRVHVRYLDLPTFMAHQQAYEIYGAFMDGDSIYELPLETKGFLVLGNESNGISPDIEQLVTKRVSIPPFGIHKKTESLNVATATAILLSEFKRRSTGR